MKKWQKALTMALAGAGCFMVYTPVNVQAADKTIIQQADNQGLQKVTAITQVYGDGEKVATAVLEYPQDISPSTIQVSDFATTGKEIAKVYVNNQPQTSNTSRLGRYIILEFAHQNSANDQPLNNGAPIIYTVFADGNHMYTWSFAYDIEAIRDWLFDQRKDKTAHPQHSILARAIQDAGVASYKAGDYAKALQNFYAADAKGQMKAPRYIGLCYDKAKATGYAN